METDNKLLDKQALNFQICDSGCMSGKCGEMYPAMPSIDGRRGLTEGMAFKP